MPALVAYRMIPGFETGWHAAAVFLGAVAAGAANAIAGGGSAISFPILVFVGLPPVSANATNAVGLWPGGVAAAWSYRARIRQIRPRTRWLAVPALVGGLLGGWLLLELPASWFAALAPFLVIGAAASVGLEPLIKRRLGSGEIGSSYAALRTGMIALFAVAVYGGYFGAGMGLMILTTLALLGLHDLQHANAAKNLLAVLIKLPALVYFIALGTVDWRAAALMATGAVAGGWLAGHHIQKVETEPLRWVITALGVALGLLMLAR